MPNKNILLLSVLAVLIPLALSQSAKSAQVVQVDDQQVVVTSKVAVSDGYVGIVRDSGLTVDDKSRFNILDVNYQLTELATATVDGVEGYYLMGAQQLSRYIGKCVKIEGTLVKNGSFSDISKTYQRALLNAEHLTVLEPVICTPNQGVMTKLPMSNKESKMSGVLRRVKRESPDCRYDYHIELTRPYKELVLGVNELYETVPVMPESKIIWQRFENAIDKKVVLRGSVEWGSAQSRYLSVTEVR